MHKRQACNSKKKLAKIAAAAFLAAFQLGAKAGAEDVSVRASVDQKQVPLNGQLELSVEVAGTQQAEAPEIQTEGFSAQYIGPSTQISIINGAMSSSITHTYLLTPKKEGNWTIGPLTVHAGGRVFKTDPIAVEVTPGGAAATSPGPGFSTADQDGERTLAPPVGDRLQLQLGVDRTKAYVNQSIPARIQFLVGGVAVRSVEMPTLEAEGFLVKPVKQPTQSQVMVAGEPYTLLQFDTELTPIKSGALTLGPATITCQVAQRKRTQGRRRVLGREPFEDFFGNPLLDDFFGQISLSPATIKSEPLAIEVLPLPEEGKPADFHGAVGAFTLHVDASPTQLSAGEPVTITTRVRGEGNQESIHAPIIELDPAQFKSYEPQPKVQAQTQGALPEKAFEQVVIPLNSSVKEIPQVKFSYFDPAQGRYETLTQGPIPLTVKAAPVEPRPAVIEQAAPALSPTQQPEVLGRDLVFIKEEMGALRPADWRWYRPAWLALLLAPLLLLGASEALRRQRDNLAADPALARASRALKQALGRCSAARALSQQQKISDSYAELFRAIQIYVGHRWNLPAEGVTRAEVERHALVKSAPEGAVTGLLECIDRCDAARFAPASVASGQLGATIALAESSLKQLERWKPA